MKKISSLAVFLTAILLFSSYSKPCLMTPYKIKIADQIWMAKNLNTATFRNGDPVPRAQTDEEWRAAAENGEPAWCYYQNNPENGEQYGKLYNWYAVNDPRGLAPEGWRIPTDEDWSQLVQYYGGSKYAGRRIVNPKAWEKDGYNPHAKGFKALPGGLRYARGNFGGVGNEGYWWSSTENDNQSSWFRRLDTYYGELNRFSNEKSFGFSVRCIKE